jgi:hypothetical protein
LGRVEPSNRTIIGVALLLSGSVLLGVGMHHVVATGPCSSTGYSSHYGPVPFCPPGEGWWIMFVIVGILLAVFGGILSGGSSATLIVPAVFAGIGIGTLTILSDSNVTSGTKTFAAIFGGALALLGVAPALLVGGARLRGQVQVQVRNGRGRSRAPHSAAAASPRSRPAPAPPSG